jgi:hypothetical protein
MPSSADSRAATPALGGRSVGRDVLPITGVASIKLANLGVLSGLPGSRSTSWRRSAQAGDLIGRPVVVRFDHDYFLVRTSGWYARL